MLLEVLVVLHPTITLMLILSFGPYWFYCTGATATLVVDGEPISSGRVNKTMPLFISLAESFDVGQVRLSFC